MKKYILFGLILLTPCLLKAENFQEAFQREMETFSKDVFLDDYHPEIKTYYKQKNFKNAIQLLLDIVDNGYKRSNNTHQELSERVIDGFSWGIVEENNDYFDSQQGIEKLRSLVPGNIPDDSLFWSMLERASYVVGSETTFGDNLNSRSIDISFSDFLATIGYYYATGNHNVVEFMHNLVSKSQNKECIEFAKCRILFEQGPANISNTPTCQSIIKNVRQTRACPDRRNAYFAKEFLNRYDKF